MARCHCLWLNNFKNVNSVDEREERVPVVNRFGDIFNSANQEEAKGLSSKYIDGNSGIFCKV